MSAPYWGQLPPRKAGQTTARRLSDDLTSPTDRRQSLDVPGQTQPRSNRVSVQTTKSDAPTDSTLSPFASPTASSFQGQGLAPRPPSLPYGANQYPPELIENRRRRRSRNQEQDNEYAATAGPLPPAAPEVPRAPPVSYKYPTGNAGPPQGPPALRTGKVMAPEEYYMAPTPVDLRRDAHPVLDRTRNALDTGIGGSPRAQRNTTDPALARNASARDEVNGHRRRASGADQNLRGSRRTSLNQPTERSRMFADDRSPLQRLELTLDSISKEDKRARLEAAERVAREKTTGVEPTSQPQSEKSPPTQQVRFHDRQPSTAGHEESNSQSQTLTSAAPVPVTPTRPSHSGAASMGPLSQNPPEEGRKYGSGSGRSPWTQGQAPESQIPVPVMRQPSGVPQRNLSFRERAARNDIKPPNGLDVASPKDDEAKTPTNGMSLARSGSNKLKKNPPGDPWFHTRMELEERYPSIEIRTVPPAATTREAGGASGPSSNAAGFASASGPGRVNNGHGPDRSHTVDEYLDQDAVTTPPGPTKLIKTPSQRKADQILGRRSPPQHLASSATRRNTPPLRRSPPPTTVNRAMVAVPAAAATAAVATTHHPARREARSDSDSDSDREGHHHHISDMVHRARDKYEPGDGLFKPTKYLDEWRKATIGTLSGALLDLEDVPPAAEKKKNANAAWWESPSSKRRSSMSSRPKKAEAFEGEYDDTNAPTRFKPPLYLKCGPLLRYCGIRHERAPPRPNRNGAIVDKEIWRGSVMIVTTDADSSYDIAPTLRLFVQPLELLPPPPREINGDEPLAAEYVDPIAGHPKLGRKGETLYVRPVDHLDEAKDLSRDETDEGLFEKSKSPPDVPLTDGATDAPGSFSARRKRAEMDGEKAGKYKEVRGFRLHQERGFTFWRFNIEVELREKQQRIAYRINRGPSTGFWVPAKGQAMNIMFHSCNGFSVSVESDQFSGPDPMWRDVLNTHQSQPFHVMLGGGDQIYNDRCMQDTKLFKEWLGIRNPVHKEDAPFTPEMQDELETFYLHRYAMWFSQGLFGMANSQIPMVNMFDDHDIFDGFGSYNHGFMTSPVFSGLGNVAFKYYMLFQHQSVVDETETSEPSWTLGAKPGPYIKERSRSLFMELGSKVALLAVDARTERRRDEVISKETWEIIMDRCYGEIEKGKIEHLLVLLGVPIAYPRLVWLENILTSRLMDPIKALGKFGLLGNFLNRLDGGVEVLDDLDDHWTAKNHKHERAIVIEDLQDLAAGKSIRVTVLSGDVHLAAVGQFYSNPKLGIPKHKDFRYIPNIISSAIVNTPPPDLLADVLNKRNKVHHFDKETDEDMIPIFGHGVDGKSRNNKSLLPHRNWCAIREYVPGNTPPPSPGQSAYDLTPLGTPPGSAQGGVGGIIRRLSNTRSRGPSFRGPDGVRDRTRPPISGGLFRSFSRRRGSASADDVGNPPYEQNRPGFLTRTLSGSSVSGRLGGLFRRRNSNAGAKKHDDGGINGNWGGESDEDYGYDEEVPRNRGVGLRGGLGDYPHDYEDEYVDGDESYFSARPQNQQPLSPARDNSKPLPPEPTPVPMPVMSGARGNGNGNGNGVNTNHGPIGMSRPAPTAGDVAPEQEFRPKEFRRAPTGLSMKQIKRGGAEELAVDLSGALEVCLNVEISQRDPGGSTVPYRLVVPRLWYDEELEEMEVEGGEAKHGRSQSGGVGGIKRLISLRRS